MKFYCNITLTLLCSSLLVNGLQISNTNNASRRQFFETGVLTTTAAVIGSNANIVNAEDESAVIIDSALKVPPLQIENGKILNMPKIGTGAWAWGDALFWGYNPKEDSELAEVFQYAVNNGGGFFDTAELYGLGRSETLIGDFETKYGVSNQISVATKFAPFPWRTDRKSVVKAAEASVRRLNGRPIDLYQIHFPNAYSNSAYWDGIADAYDKGLIKAVGVSNYGKDAIRACHAALEKRGIPLASNQIQMSLVYREALNNGLKETCDELGVKVISYSPLGLGLLTGKYNADNLPKGPRKILAQSLFTGENAESSSRLLGSMNNIASKYDATCSQVAINWAIAKGTTPIPGARTLKQAKSNLNSLTWSLSTDDVAELDAAAKSLPPLTPPESSPFPKVDKDTGLVMFDS